jgi:hypothetical protein
MTSSTLSKYYLRRGLAFDGALLEPKIPFWVQIKNAGYRLWIFLKKDQ